jgi:hypothetical protein
MLGILENDLKGLTSAIQGDTVAIAENVVSELRDLETGSQSEEERVE